MAGGFVAPTGRGAYNSSPRARGRARGGYTAADTADPMEGVKENRNRAGYQSYNAVPPPASLDAGPQGGRGRGNRGGRVDRGAGRGGQRGRGRGD
jgi:hypothetical protein